MDKWLVSVEKCGKVVALYFSKRLKEFAAIRAMHKGCEIIATSLNVKSSVEDNDDEKVESGKCLTKQVKCIETGEIFSSVSECAETIKVPRWNLYKAIQRGTVICKRRYDYVK